MEDLSMKRAFFAGVITLAAVMLGGCPSPTPTPPPEAVLAGTWTMTGDAVDPQISELQLTFDSNGDLTKISYVVDGLVRVTIDQASFINSDTSVSGSDVTIVANWFTVNNIVISGTLNASQDQITGSASYVFVAGGVTIEAPVGDVTLTKQ
jgi:hypothetical protein